MPSLPSAFAIIGLLIAAPFGSAILSIDTAAAQTRIIPMQVPPRPPAIWFDHVSGERTTNGWGGGNPLRWHVGRNGNGWIELRDNSGDRMQRRPFQLDGAQLQQFANHIRAFRARVQDDGVCRSDQAISTVRWRIGGTPGETRFDHGCSSAGDRAQIGHLEAALAIMRSAARAPAGDE